MSIPKQIKEINKKHPNTTFLVGLFLIFSTLSFFAAVLSGPNNPADNSIPRFLNNKQLGATGITIDDNDNLSADDFHIANLWMATNANSGTTIDFSGPGRETRVISADLTITAASNWNTTNYNDKIVMYRASGANRTITWPAEWITPDGSTSTVVTNNQWCQVSYSMQVNEFTNVVFNKLW